VGLRTQLLSCCLGQDLLFWVTQAVGGWVLWMGTYPCYSEWDQLQGSWRLVRHRGHQGLMQDWFSMGLKFPAQSM
jgi:hypothetical protein